MNDFTTERLKLIEFQLERAQEVAYSEGDPNYKTGYMEATIDNVLEDVRKVLTNGRI